VFPSAGVGERLRGIYSTPADISSFWQSLFAGRILSAQWFAEMGAARSDVARRARL